MKEKRHFEVNRIILLLVICSVITYVFLRAYYLSFTHDECVSFKIVTGDNEYSKTANNHFLNTWLMTAFYYFFGGREIYLRLPNVLAFILYSFISYKILIKANNTFLMLLGTSLLLLNPYLLEFFSLARGYGLSLGFGLAALYFLFKQDHYTTYKQFITSLSFSLLLSLISAYSNLICINLNVAIMVVYFAELFLIMKNKTIIFNKKRTGVLIFIFLLNLFFLLLIINQLLILKNNHQLYYGGEDGFIDNTLTYLIQDSIYFSYYGEHFWILIRQVAIIIFATTIVYQIYCKLYSSLTKIAIITFLMIMATIMQHYLFDALYPAHRTSLIFIPLFALFIYYLALNINIALFSISYIKIAYNILILVLLCLPLEWHFIKNMNLIYTREWRYDSQTKSMMKNIVEQNKNSINTKKNISISNNWFFEPSINYYRGLYSMDYLQPANRNGIDKNADYIYCTKEEMGKLFPEDCYSILSDYKDIETTLLKKSVCN